MYKIGFLLFLTTVSSKVIKPSYEYIIFEQFNTVEEYPPLKKPLPHVSAWVLSLNKDVDSLKLRAATSEEARDVFGARSDEPSYRQPRLENEPQNPWAPEEPSSSSKDSTQVSGKALLDEIMRVINKFALTTHSEPDSFIGEDAEKGLPTLKLYFKDVHTSLVVRAEGRRWHYIIGPPSLFPEWFHEAHKPQTDSEGAFVNVPKNVANEFYKALLHMLTMFLSIPV